MIGVVAPAVSAELILITEGTPSALAVQISPCSPGRSFWDRFLAACLSLPDF